MKRFIYIVLGIIITPIILFLVLFYFPDFKYSLKDFSISDITINSTRHDVNKMFGNPLRKEDDNVTWLYPGLTIEFYRNKVNIITITSDKYQTYRGVKVGDSIDQLNKKYGKLQSFSLNRKEINCYFQKSLQDISNPLLAYKMYFIVSNRKINKIEIGLITD